MRISSFTTIIVLATSLTGCSSLREYFIDRGRDAADIATVAVGIGAGGKARVGPLQTGLLLQFDGVGLRGGTFPELQDDAESWFIPNTADIQFFFRGGESFRPNGSLASSRHKTFTAGCEGGDFPFFHTFKNEDGMYYYTQIDAVLALGPSLRVGFNPGEILDFILGWATVDIYDDDVEKNREQKDVSSNNPENI